MNKKHIKILLLIFPVIFLEGCMSNMTGAKVTKKNITINKTNTKNVDFVETYKNLLAQSQVIHHREVFYNRIKSSIEPTKLTTADYSSIEIDDSENNTIEYQNLKNSNVKYRRSSLYTLMVSDTIDKYNFIYRHSFGKAQIPHKFNSHNIGPFLIPAKPKNIDRSTEIEQYLNQNNIAKQLVARWFNRNSNGAFNMDLVAKRGEYNASELDIKIALNSVRGRGLLKDAGEELISNTFIIIYDFTNESTGNSAMTGYPTMSFHLKAYLYRLVWDDKTAAIFYNDYWVDKTNTDVSRVQAFEKSDVFKLKFVGSSVVKSKNVANTEQNIMTFPKVIDQLMDNSMADLQRNYEEFRIKFPLSSGNPITAKIGKKEGIKEGDKFEVLEQILNEDGTTRYQKMGEIRVGSEKDIWDNTSVGDWFGNSSLEHTIFKGQSGSYHPGMLIRQIN